MASTQLTAGEKVGKYQIRKLLGEGGMGAVYLAYDPLIEREVALKVLSQDVGNSESALQRFLGEARAIGRLNNPYVVSIYDIDQWNGRYYLVMELLSGGSVAGYAEQNGALPWEDACRLVAQAARGLAAAHVAGMIHRDIKPENLMLTADGQVKVVDFGLSKLLDASHDTRTAVTKAGQILGTPQYMSPEQFEAEQTDARTDIYSLGATLFRLLTARFPYHDCRSILQVMTAHLSKPPPIPSELVPTLPGECNRIVARAMAKRPVDRYQTATELADELQALIDGKSSGPVAAAPSATTSSAEESLIEEDRPLTTACILEPSKLQAAVLKDALSRAGAKSVQILQTKDAARQAVEQAAPDLLITAMQLPDGRGIDLLEQLSRSSLLQRTAVVLNSSDSAIEELVAAGAAACLVLAPKKVRPDDILRVIHACGPCQASSGPLTAALNSDSVRLRVELDSDRIPAILADSIRELRLLNVEVIAKGASAAAGSEPPHLTLVLRTARSTPGDNVSYPALLSHRTDSGGLLACVQSDRGHLFLRAVGCQGVMAVCRRPLNARRLVCLFQACQPVSGN